MNERVLYVVLCACLVLYAPYWAYLSVLFIGIMVFPRFWEAIVIAAFVDYYYGSHTSIAYPFAIASALLILAASELRGRMRFSL